MKTLFTATIATLTLSIAANTNAAPRVEGAASAPQFTANRAPDPLQEATIYRDSEGKINGTKGCWWDPILGWMCN